MTSEMGSEHSARTRTSEEPGAVLGHYVLVEKLGEGGFGTVWRAEQKEPVRRMVALKILKLGMDTKQVVARFDQERQALALMDHPNIAKVFDAGATDIGRPYFVMELVQGVPLLDYCDGERLGTRERLELFIDVCRAIQHAHQKGVIHRDIKPSNVLVTVHDGKPVPKVIDFGIAKATSIELTTMTLFTEQRQVIGTPAYMSPEQAETSGLDIDTRSDIYSLGVVLYELLTGTVPFDMRALLQQGYGEMMRALKEVEPHKPSTRVSTMGDTATHAAARRSADPRRLTLTLRGDLDWIVMRCLEKDRARRYDTANGLAQDIQRHLAGEPVEAAPPSALYRFQKLVRRNKGAAIASAVVLAALIAGLVSTLWQANIASRERDLARHEAERADDRAAAAERAESEQRRLALSEAEQRAEAQKQRLSAEQSAASEKHRAEELDKVAKFQASMLSGIDPTDAGAALARDLRERLDAALAKSGMTENDRAQRARAFDEELARVNSTDAALRLIDRTILAPAADAVAKQFKDQPAVDASLRQTLAELYTGLALYDAAVPLQEFALATRRRVLGEEHPDTLTSIHDTGYLLMMRGKLAEAEAFYREALEKRRRVLGADHPQTIATEGSLGSLLMDLGRFDEAEPFVRDSLAAARRVLGNEDRDTLIRVNVMGFLLVDQGKLAEAEPYWREAYETGKRVLGADDKDTLVWTNNMGSLVSELGRRAEAEKHYREAYEVTRRVRGEEHPGTLTCAVNLAIALKSLGRMSEAETLMRQSLDVRRRTLGEDHPDTLSSYSNLGGLYRDEEKLDEAVPLLSKAFEGLKRTLGPDHPSTLSTMISLAKLSMRTGNDAEAEALYRAALENSKQVWNEDHPERLIVMNDLGSLLARTDRVAEAEPLLVDLVARRRRVSGDDHPETLVARSNYGVMLEHKGELAAAEKEYRDLVERFRRVYGEEHPNTLSCIALHAGALRALRRFADAEPLYRAVADTYERTLGDDHPRTVRARIGLGRTLTGLARFAEAEEELAAAERSLSSSQKAQVDLRESCLEGLVSLYDAWEIADPDHDHAARRDEWKKKLEALAAPADAAAKR
jgi:serine/threonine protein kinase